MFCPISGKNRKQGSRKKSSSQKACSQLEASNKHNNITNNANNNHNHNHHNHHSPANNGCSANKHHASHHRQHHHTNNHATSSPIRYVIESYKPEVDDEISVEENDVVFFLYFSEQSDEWSYVYHQKNSKQGYVPTRVLTHDAQYRTKKKTLSKSQQQLFLDQHHRNTGRVVDMQIGVSSLADQHMLNHHLPLHSLHPHHIHHSHHPMPYSPQGSSSKQSYCKSIDLQVPQSFSPHHQRTCFNVKPQVMCNEQFDFLLDNFGVYLVLYNFIEKQENEISVDRAEYVTVLNKDDKDWYWVRRERDLKQGFVPMRFVCEYEHIKKILSAESTISSKSIHNDVHTYTNTCINQNIEQDSAPTDRQSCAFSKTDLNQTNLPFLLS